MNKFISLAVITSAVALSSTANAGVTCLNSAAACAAILDYLLSDTGNGVSEAYTAVKNDFRTRACPFSSSETGVYSYYAHSHELDAQNRGEVLGETMSACSNSHSPPCLR